MKRRTDVAGDFMRRRIMVRNGHSKSRWLNWSLYRNIGWGSGSGQFIYVVPDLTIVVAITSDIDGHREYHRDIVREYIVPAVIKE